jgi:hypothetical protein
LAGRPCPPDAAAACCLATGGGPTQLTESVWPRPVSVPAGSQRRERAGWNGPAPLPPSLAAGSNALAPYGRGEGRDTPRRGAAFTPRRADCRPTGRDDACPGDAIGRARRAQTFLGEFAGVNGAAFAARVSPQHRCPRSPRRLDPVLARTDRCISVAKLVHGTTVATSTILERKGARTASWRIPPATTMPVLPVQGRARTAWRFCRPLRRRRPRGASREPDHKTLKR